MLKIAPLSVGTHAKLFDEIKNMLVPHLTSSNDPLRLVKHLASCSPRQTEVTALYHLMLSRLTAVLLALLKHLMEKRPESMS